MWLPLGVPRCLALKPTVVRRKGKGRKVYLAQRDRLLYFSNNFEMVSHRVVCNPSLLVVVVQITITFLAEECG